MNSSTASVPCAMPTAAASTEAPALPWEQWLSDYGNQLLLYARQFAHTGDAEDLVQEAFLRLWRRRDSLDLDSFNAKAALHQGVKWAAFDLLRRRQRRTQREDAATVLNGPPVVYFEASDANADRRRAIEDALQTLPEDQREVLVLKIWSEFTFAEVADQLGISPNTAASRYRYALTALRRRLDREACDA